VGESILEHRQSGSTSQETVIRNITSDSYALVKSVTAVSQS